MGKISVVLDEDEKDIAHSNDDEADSVIEDLGKLRQMAAGLPSMSKSKAHFFKSAPRVTWTFTAIPKPIKEMAVAEAERRGMTLKAFFLHCLREGGGLDIPPYEDLDARHR